MARHVLLLSALAVQWAPSWSAAGSGSAAGDHSQAQAAAAAVREQLVVDKLLDNVLVTVQRQLSAVGLDTAALPEWSGNSGRLTLTANDGLMHRLSSIRRAGSAIAEYGDGSVALSTNVTLDVLEIGYHVQADYLFLSRAADVAASVASNSVYFKAGIFYQGDSCYVGLEDVSLVLLDGIHWRTTGFSPIDSIVSAAINLLVPPSRIRGWINDGLTAALHEFKSPCHDLIPGVGSGLSWLC